MKILYFAWIRETVGKSTEDVSLSDGIKSVGDLVGWLRQQGANYDTAFADDTAIRVAVNQEYVKLDHPVANGDEVAFFPPVTGG